MSEIFIRGRNAIGLLRRPSWALVVSLLYPDRLLWSFSRAMNSRTTFSRCQVLPLPPGRGEPLFLGTNPLNSSVGDLGQHQLHHLWGKCKVKMQDSLFKNYEKFQDRNIRILRQGWGSVHLHRSMPAEPAPVCVGMICGTLALSQGLVSIGGLCCLPPRGKKERLRPTAASTVSGTPGVIQG